MFPPFRTGTIILIAAVVRILLPLAAYSIACDAGIFRAPDTSSYLACARSLAREGSFSMGGAPEIVRTPGYPLMLVPGVVLGHVTALTVPVQIAIGCVTVWLVYRLALALAGTRRAAAAAGLLCAFEPLSSLYCSILLAETLFAALLVLALSLFVRSLREGRLSSLALSACALAAAVYVKPIAYWLPAVVAVVLVAQLARERTARAVLRPVVFLVLSAALIGAWQVRNWRVAGYRAFSAITDLNHYFYQGAAVTAATHRESYYDIQEAMGERDPDLYFADHQEQRGLPAAEVIARMGRQGRAIIRAHPRMFAAIYLKGIARTLLDPGAVDYLKFFGAYQEGSGLLGEIVDRGLTPMLAWLRAHRPAVFWMNVLLGIVLLVYLGCMIAGVTDPRARGFPVAAVVLAGLYLLLHSGGVNAVGRFRHPIMPLICVLGGLGIARLQGARQAGIYRTRAR
jgi:4-amino-4-deoxy-L-arabinose transferase-like glycosyltransferase